MHVSKYAQDQPTIGAVCSCALFRTYPYPLWADAAGSRLAAAANTVANKRILAEPSRVILERWIEHDARY